MKHNFDESLRHVLKHEGGYVNHPKDPGGATNKGVTIGTLKSLGIDVDGDGDSDIADLKKLSDADVAKVYRLHYWNKVDGDGLPSGLDFALFDLAVNSGVGRAAQFKKKLRNGAPIDQIGELMDMRLAFLKRVRNKKTKALLWPEFGRGWQRRVDDVRHVALAMARKPSPVTSPAPPVAVKPSPAPVVAKTETAKTGATSAVGKGVAATGILGAGAMWPHLIPWIAGAFLLALAVWGGVTLYRKRK